MTFSINDVVPWSGEIMFCRCRLFVLVSYLFYHDAFDCLSVFIGLMECFLLSLGLIQTWERSDHKLQLACMLTLQSDLRCSLLTKNCCFWFCSWLLSCLFRVWQLDPNVAVPDWNWALGSKVRPCCKEDFCIWCVAQTARIIHSWTASRYPNVSFVYSR